MEVTQFINRQTNIAYQLPVYHVDDAFYIRVRDVHEAVACASKVNKWIPEHGKFKFPELVEQYGIHPNEKFVLVDDMKKSFGIDEEAKHAIVDKYVLTFDTGSGIDTVCTYTYQNETYVAVEDAVNIIGSGSWNSHYTVKRHRLPAVCEQLGFRMNKPFITLEDFRSLEIKKFGDREQGYALLFDVTVNSPKGVNIANLSYMKLFGVVPKDVRKYIKNSMLWNGLGDVEVKCALIPFPTRLMLTLNSRGVTPVFSNWYNTFPLMNAIEAHCENYNCDFNDSVTHLVVKADVKHC